MACAMAVIPAGLPERDAGKRIEIDAARTCGKASHRNADHAFQHKREEAFLRFADVADGDGSSDIGRAVAILATGIDEEEFAGLQLPVCLPGYAVVNDRAVRAGAGNRVE